MSTFSYIALSPEGKQTSGKLTADSRAAALSQIMQQGLSPVSIDQARDEAAAEKKKAVASASAIAKGKVPPRLVLAFTRELANLLAGGVPLARALMLLRRETSHAVASYVWGAVHDAVVGGKALAEAMAEWPRCFSSVYVAMVRAGEAGGFLDVVLAQIAEFRLREQDLKGKVAAALIYPIVLSVLGTIVLIVMITFFIPRFQGIFQQSGGDLPAITRGVVAISDVVRKYGPFLAIAAVVAAIVVVRAGQSEGGRRRIEVIMLSIPLLGTVTARFALVRFTRMLGTLIGAGVPLIDSLRVSRQAIGNQTLSDTVSDAIEQVQQGSSLSKSLVGNQKLFPSSVVEMISIAEETGRLDKELQRIATTYEADLDRHLRMLISFGEPMLLLVMAIMIGTIVIAMMLPILNLSDAIK